MSRKGKTKNILESSIDSALLAVEIYNKPRTLFKVENYIILMIIAWNRLFMHTSIILLVTSTIIKMEDNTKLLMARERHGN